MSVQITFDRVEFLKPYSFFIMLKTPSATKRTQISHCTQTPTFSTSLTIPTPTDLVLSACIVLDYSGKIDQTGQTLIFGKCTIPAREYQQALSQDGVYRAKKEFSQDNKHVVGYFEVLIQKERVSVSGEYVDEVDQFRMAEEGKDEDQGNGGRVRVDLHAGVDFAAGSGYYLQVGWSDKYHSPYPKYLQSSKMVQNEMNPFWHQQLVLPLENKLRNGFLNIILRDKDNNLLEQASFELSRVKIFHYYHVELRIKEEIQAARPRVFFSFVLEALPEKSFTEEICELSVTNLEMSPEPQANRRFVLVFAHAPVEKINFLKLQMSAKGQCPEVLLLEQWRKQPVQYFLSPILISPIQPSTAIQSSSSSILFSLPFLKSKLIKQNTFLLYSLPKAQKFSPSNFELLASSSDCTSTLKSVFYEQQKNVVLLSAIDKNSKMRCVVELGSQRPPASDQTLESQPEPLKSDRVEFQKWKALSNQVFLKQKLVHSMEKEIDERTNNIEKKGDTIQGLRRAQEELTRRKKYLTNKAIQEQSINIQEPVIEEKVNMKELYIALNTTASELEHLIQSNAQTRVKLQWLSTEKPKLNTKKLQDEYTKNSKLITQMQERINKIPFYNEIIRRQKESILKLQKLFQQSQIDKQMNELLHKQLQKMKEKNNPKAKPKDSIEEYKLMKILHHLQEQQGQKKGSGLGQSRVADIKRQIENNEDQLKRKSEHYAKMMLRSKY